MTLSVRRYLCHPVLFVNYSLLLLLQSCWNKYFNITNDLKTFLWKKYQGQKNIFSNRSKALIAHPSLSASISPIFIVSPSRHGHISSNSSVSSNQHRRSFQSSQAEMSPVARYSSFFHEFISNSDDCQGQGDLTLFGWKDEPDTSRAASISGGQES